MSGVIVEMSMSLDGYIAGPGDGDASPLGDGGQCLHQWMFAGGAPGDVLAEPGREVFDELRGETGAMISGRRLYDITRGWSGSHPFAGIPVFVVTHAPPAVVPDGATPFTFVTEGVANAVARAQLAAGGKSVYVIGGASIDQQLLAAGLVDELRIERRPCPAGRRRVAVRRAPPHAGGTAAGEGRRVQRRHPPPLPGEPAMTPEDHPALRCPTTAKTFFLT